MKKTEVKSEKKSLVKKVIAIIIIIFILLTGCTSGFFGKVGRLFENFSEYMFGNNQKIEKIYNEELKFISKNGKVKIDDVYKIEFKLEDVSSDEFTCITSDADIATCVVKDNYVEVYPKKMGKVTVSVITEANGKEYIGTHKLTVEDVVREIILNTSNLNMYLNESNFIKIPFRLNNLEGNVEVSISNHNVLKAVVKNNTIEITSIAPGTSTITLSVKYNDKVYSNKLSVNVYAKREVKPVYIKSSVNSLNKITINNSELIPEFNKDVLNYTVNVGSDVSKITLEIEKTDSKSKITYYYDDKKIESLNNLKLSYGENKLEIHVEAEDGTIKKYTIIINREATPELSDINTLDKITGLSGFNKNTLNYNIELENSVSKITLSPVKTDSKSTLRYYVDGVRVDSLNNISLVENITKKIEIVVISESGNKKTYTLNFKRKDNGLSTINTLESLTIKNYNFAFDKNTKNYEVIVDYNTSSIDLDYVLSSTSSSVTHKLNSNVITDIDSINLNEGVNKLEVTIKSESGVNNTYVINIKKPIRKIVLDKTITKFNIESGSVDVIYNVYEDKNITSEFTLVTNYNLEDVIVNINNFKGTYTKHTGYVTLNFSNQDIDNTYTLNIKYLNKVDNLTFKVNMNEYYASTLKDNYTFDLNDIDTNIILNTNIFNNDIEYLNITNGIRMYNNKGYIDITSQDTNVLKVLSNLDNSNTTYIAFKLSLLSAGSTNINITGKVYDREIINKDITVNVNKKYSVVIDANGGMFNSFTDKYEYLKEKNETISLSEFNPYKIDETGNCLYYVVDSYNTLSDGTGISYQVNDVLTITDDITLYAIYKSSSEYKEIEEDKTIYLTDIDLFYNEEYYKYYNIKKMIYPGANGSHVMYLENNTDSTITFKSFNIKENTTCNSNGCINIGYVVKYTKPNQDNWNYIYGSSNEYKILNSDSNANKNYVDGENSIKIDINDEMTLNPGEKITVSILWEWVEINDRLDTELGYIATDEYVITISLDYKEVNTYCDLD